MFMIVLAVLPAFPTLITPKYPSTNKKVIGPVRCYLAWIMEQHYYCITKLLRDSIFSEKKARGLG